MSEALPHLLSFYIDIDRPHDGATRVLLIQPDSVAAFAEGLSPAHPGPTVLRSLAMSWASALGSYGSGWGAASFCKSPRRRRIWSFRFARLSGMVPSRTARRMVSSHRPVSSAAVTVSSSALSHAAAAAPSFLSRAIRAEAA